MRETNLKKKEASPLQRRGRGKELFPKRKTGQPSPIKLLRRGRKKVSDW